MSVISGYIQLRDREFHPHAKQAIGSYDFDPIRPFTNIFRCDSPAQFFFPIIGIAGSYKQIEEVWSEWMWKFSEFLSPNDVTPAAAGGEAC